MGSIDDKLLKLSLLCLLIKNLNDYVDAKKYALSLTIERLNNDIKQICDFKFEFDPNEIKVYQHIMLMFNNILVDYNKNDILTKIFNEILIWIPHEKKTTQKNGTVITLDFVAKIMADEIQPGAKTILDTCAGTGALEIPFIGQNYNITVNELDKTRFKLLTLFMKCNFGNTFTCLNMDALELHKQLPNQKFDFIIINPPYANGLYLKFLKSAFELLAVGGRLCAIFPITAIKDNHKFMDYVRQQPIKIIKTILMNPKLFNPMVPRVDTAIVVFQKVETVQQVEPYEFPAYEFYNDNCVFVKSQKCKIRKQEQFTKPTKFKMMSINSSCWYYNDPIEDYKEPIITVSTKSKAKQVKTINKAEQTEQTEQTELNLNDFKTFLIDYQKQVLKEQILTQSSNNEQIIRIEDEPNTDINDLFDYCLSTKLKSKSTSLISNINFIKGEIKNCKNIQQSLIKELLNKINDKYKPKTFDINPTFENVLMSIRNKQEEQIYATPIDIIKLVSNELKLNEHDNFIDFCAGSGGFCLEALINKRCKMVYYNDISFSTTSMFAPLGLIFPNLKIFNKNCLNVNSSLFNKFHKIAINPSFDTFEELNDFVNLGSDLLVKNGLMTVIVPINQINTIKNEKLILIKIINVNNKPYNITTPFSIMIFIKSQITHKPQIFDYDAGFKTFKHRHYVIHEPILKIHVEADIQIDELKIKLNDILKEKQLDEYLKNLTFDMPIFDETKFKKFSLNTLFKPQNHKNHQTNENVVNGKYPLIGAAKTNNGIVGYLDTYDCEGNAYSLVKTGDGGAGYLFYHDSPFNASSSVLILKCKIKNFNCIVNCPLISYQLHKIQSYNHSKSINQNNFKNIEVYIYDCQEFNIEPIIQFNFNKIRFDDSKFKYDNLNKYFEMTHKTINYKYSTQGENTGNIPLFACKKLDNGIAKYVDKPEYEGDVLVVVKHRNATAGYTFHYNGPLAYNSSCFVIKPKKLINLDINAMLLTIQLCPNHSQIESLRTDFLDERKCWIYDDSD